MDRTAFEPDARSLAVLEGVRIAREDLRAAGGAYDLDQVRTLMGGVTRQAVEKRVQEGSLLSVSGPSNRRSFSTLQFNGDGTLVAGLREVREALPTRNAWTILNFLAQPDDRLDGRKPIDLLKAAEIKLVVEAARRVGQHGVTAPLPPADLATRTPEIVTLPAGSVLHRFYTATFEPIFFDPSRDGRLNAPDGSYGVLYAAK